MIENPMWCQPNSKYPKKRFSIKIDDVDSSIIVITRDDEDFAWFLSDVITDKQVEKVVDLLNEQSEKIGELQKENENLKQQVILAQKGRNVYMKALLER